MSLIGCSAIFVWKNRSAYVPSLYPVHSKSFSPKLAVASIEDADALL